MAHPVWIAACFKFKWTTLSSPTTSSPTPPTQPPSSRVRPPPGHAPSLLVKIQLSSVCVYVCACVCVSVYSCVCVCIYVSVCLCMTLCACPFKWIHPTWRPGPPGIF
jgi:hypothetical protein